jgi:hypothetical protein
MQGLRAGVDHLYPWSYAHNILNPMNVAMDKNDQPVILDFGSCRTFGETLLSGGSPDWVDEDFSASVAYQDLDALRKSETWLGERRVERRMAKSSEMLVGGGTMTVIDLRLMASRRLILIRMARRTSILPTLFLGKNSQTLAQEKDLFGITSRENRFRSAKTGPLRIRPERHQSTEEASSPVPR